MTTDNAQRPGDALPHLTQTPPRIGWLLTGDFFLASSRLQGYRVHEYLSAHGFDSRILAQGFGAHEKGYSPTFFKLARNILRERLDIVFFQKPGWMMFKMSEILRLRGVKTIAIQCDPFSGDYGRYFDATVLASEELKRQLRVEDAYVIDDMLEVPPQTYKRSYFTQANRLRVVWVGQGTGSGGKHFIMPFLHQLSQDSAIAGAVEFVTISRGDWATHEWTLDTVYDLICGCDVAIIPLPESDWANAKSANKLTMLMALGIPTVVTPIPSYLRIVKHGINSLLARTPGEFAAAIKMYRDKGLRERLGTAGRISVQERFSTHTLGAEWIKLIDRVRQHCPVTPAHPKFSTRAVSRVVQLAARLYTL